MESDRYKLFINGREIPAFYTVPDRNGWDRLIAYGYTLAGRLAPVSSHGVPSGWPKSNGAIRQKIKTGGNVYDYRRV